MRVTWANKRARTWTSSLQKRRSKPSHLACRKWRSWQQQERRNTSRRDGQEPTISPWTRRCLSSCRQRHRCIRMRRPKWHRHFITALYNMRHSTSKTVSPARTWWLEAIKWASSAQGRATIKLYGVLTNMVPGARFDWSKICNKMILATSQWSWTLATMPYTTMTNTIILLILLRSGLSHLNSTVWTRQSDTDEPNSMVNI